MNYKTRLLCFSLLLGILICSTLLAAKALSYAPAWAHVRRSMDCNGKTIEINAVTDANLPKTVCEYRSSNRMWDEEELRAFLSVAASTYTNMPHFDVRDPSSRDNHWILKDESAEVLASCEGGLCLEHYGQMRGRYSSMISGHAFVQRCTEPIDSEDIQSLRGLGYTEALKMIEPALKSTGLTLGEPMTVEVYDLDSLTAGQKKFEETFQEQAGNVWQAEDEAYLLEYPVYFQGARLHPQGGYVAGEESVVYTSLSILLRADGTILDLRVDSIMDNPVAIGSEEAPMSLNDMMDIYAQYLSSVIWPESSKPTVHRIMLEYIAWQSFTGEEYTYRLIPVWSFYSRSNDPAFPMLENVQLFHAVTGEHLDH